MTYINRTLQDNKYQWIPSTIQYELYLLSGKTIVVKLIKVQGAYVTIRSFRARHRNNYYIFHLRQL